MHIVIALLGFLIGIILGYLAFKTIGWLPCLILLACITPTTTANATITIQLWTTQGNLATFSRTGCGSGTEGSVQWLTDHYEEAIGDGAAGNTWTLQCTGGSCFSFPVSAGGTYSKNCDGTTHGAPPPTYYWNGSITNNSGVPITVKWIGADGHQESKNLGPGQDWQFGYTNSTWFNGGQWCWTGYASDGTALQLQCSGNIPITGTNSYSPGPGWNPQPGGLGGPGNIAGTPAGNTNLTGLQYYAGVSNIVGAQNAGFTYLASTLNTLGTNFNSQGQSLLSLGYTGTQTVNQVQNVASNTLSANQYLRDLDTNIFALTNAIPADTARQNDTTNKLSQITNQLAQANNIMSNLNQSIAGTNSTSIFTLLSSANSGTNDPRITAIMTNTFNSATGDVGFLNWAAAGGISNIVDTELSNALWFSNSIVQLFLSDTGGFGYWYELTNLAAAQPGDSNFWNLNGQLKSNVFNSAGGGVRTLSLDPRQHKLFQDLVPWIKICFIWILVAGGIQYVKWRCRNLWIAIIHTPNSGPLASSSGKWGWLIKLLTTSAGASLLFGIPILVAGALDTITSHAHPVSPLSTAGVANAGSMAPVIRDMLDILNMSFPVSFAFTLAAYLFVFDITVTGYMMFATQVYRTMK